jgi:hypothetical protein
LVRSIPALPANTFVQARHTASGAVPTPAVVPAGPRAGSQGLLGADKTRQLALEWRRIGYQFPLPVAGCHGSQDDDTDIHTACSPGRR